MVSSQDHNSRNQSTLWIYCHRQRVRSGSSPISPTHVHHPTSNYSMQLPFVYSVEEIAYKDTIDETLGPDHSVYTHCSDEYLYSYSLTVDDAIQAHHSHPLPDVFSVTSTTPSTARDVLSLPEEERDLWMKSEDAEWNQILLNAVTPVHIGSLPHGTRVLPTHNVYKTKPDGTRKTRTVINGNLEHSSNVRSTYSPTTNECILRLFIGLYHHFRASDPSWIIASGDVSNAFCLAPIPEWKNVYIHPPLARYQVCTLSL